MSGNPHDQVRGLRAAARLTGRSPSGLQKLVDNGDLPATKVDGVYLFAAADLEALRATSTAGEESVLPPEPTPKAAAAEPAAPPEPAKAPPTKTLPMPEPASPDDGEVASKVFADLNAGKTLCAIVVERKLQPCYESGHPGGLPVQLQHVRKRGGIRSAWRICGST